MPLTNSQVINNRYRVVKLLGQGGFGAVYRAWDMNLNIPVALKENTETSTEAARQFAREAKILASLRHPNLTKVTDYFTIPDQGQYLVMEYVDGEDLNQKFEQNGGPLPTEVVLDWAGQILNALRYLHSQNPPIIHRDIKPQNIRLTPDGQVMLVDFGIAKLADSTTRTTVGARAITPGYSPHEQYGQGATDERSDIYALGATLYSLLTGRVPPESIARFSDDILVSPKEYNSALPDHIVNAVMKALEMDPRKRWQNAAEFLQALRSAEPVRQEAQVVVQRQEIPPTVVVPSAAPKPSAPTSAESKGKSNKLLIGGGIGIALLVLLVIGVGSIFRGLSAGGDDKTPTPLVTTAVLAPTAPPPAAEVAAPSEPIKIGLLAPLTGQVPTFGISTREGVELAVKEWNDKGGVLGRKLELIVADSQCSADPAVNAANKLIDQDGVKYIVGEVCSSASIPVAEIVNPKKVVQISPTSTNTLVTVDYSGTTRPFTFRACFIDPFQGLVMAKFAQGKGYETAFIMYDQGNDYTVGLAEAFEKEFTAMGGQIVGKEAYVSTDTDFSAILTKVADTNPEVLYIPDYYNIVNLVGAQAKDKGITAVMMGGDGWDSGDLDLAASDGGFYSNHYDPSDTRPIVVDWLRKYGEAYQENGQPKVPDALATLGYDAANLLIAAIEKAAVDDTTKVAEALAGITWEGVSGKITFDTQHNPIKAAAVIGVAGGSKAFVESVAP